VGTGVGVAGLPQAFVEGVSSLEPVRGDDTRDENQEGDAAADKGDEL